MTTNLDALRKFVQANTPERLADFDGFLLRYKGLPHDDDILLLIEAMGWNSVICEQIPGQLSDLLKQTEAAVQSLNQAVTKAGNTATAIGTGMEQLDQRVASAITNINTSELAKKFLGEVAGVLAHTKTANELLIQNAEAAQKANKFLTRSFVIYILLAGIIVGLLAGWQLQRVLDRPLVHDMAVRYLLPSKYASNSVPLAIVRASRISGVYTLLL